MKKLRLILSCEHGGNEIPRKYASLFAGKDFVLHSHRGWDPGALAVAKLLARKLETPLEYGEVSRLLIELNRSESAPDLFSKYSRHLSDREKETLKKEIYWPYVNAVEKRATSLVRKGVPTFHLSVHSFTPVLRGNRRDCDLGVLFDPAHPLEAKLASLFMQHLEREFPNKRLRFNYPYAGTGNGLTTTLRGRLPKRLYAGLEIEMNQGWLKKLIREKKLSGMTERLASALHKTLTLQPSSDIDKSG